MIILILAVVSAILLYKFLTKDYGYWKKKNVQYKEPLPIVGNFPGVAFGKESMGAGIRRSYEKFDEDIPYFGVYIFQRPYLVIKNPELVKTVLVKDFNVFRNRPFYANENIDPISGNVLFTMKNDKWRALRRKLTPIFTSGKIKMMFPLLKEVANQLEHHLEKNKDQEMDVKDLAKRYTIDSISSCAFGINAKSIEFENSEIKIMVTKMLDLTGFKRIFSTFAYLFCPILVKIFRLTFTDKESSDYMINVFKNTSEERKRKKVKRHDLIDCLHSIQEQETQDDILKLDEFKMSAQALVFFNAGSEPSSSIMSFLLYELALHPEVQNNLRTEIRENLDSEGSIPYDTLNEMKYLEMVINETLRKYPLTQLLLRQAEEDYTFEETGLKIDKGTAVLIPMSALQNDPKYFPNPENFDPERFRDGAEVYKYAFVPFGEGPRKCIGDRFALMQIKIAISMLLKNFEVSPSQNTVIPIKLNKSSLFLTPVSGTIYLNVKKIQ